MPGGFNHLNIADGYERAYDMLMKWKWIQPLRFLDSITRWMWVLTTNFPMSILHSLDMSVVLIVVKELLMWSASFVVSNPIRRIRRLVWGECFDTTYVGLLMGWVITNGAESIGRFVGMIDGAQCMSLEKPWKLYIIADLITLMRS